MKTKKIAVLLSFVIVLILIFTGCVDTNNILNSSDVVSAESNHFSTDTTPEISDEPYIVINNNKPEFSESQLTTKSYEFYSELDNLGRCGYAISCIGIDLMPTEERGSIGQVKPSGWHTIKYDILDGKYLYNRCHLIGFQLTGENANVKNLITGTRYFNVDGMLPFENMVADYIKETKNHVMFRVTPDFKDDNLVAYGVKMEAFSVEDNGEGISFNVYVYNKQPGITIDYKTGESCLTDESVKNDNTDSSVVNQIEYILNTNSKKMHLTNCKWVNDISETNKKTVTCDRLELILQGYQPCKVCNP